MPVQQYRGDIDGLRAIAVVAVVLFHAGLSGVGGGFVGVDVFFVISGFLITQIVRRETDAGRFDIGRFYDRRIRRILPALLPFFALTMVAGFVVLLPADLVELAKETLASMAFVSNVKFWRGADYWFTGLRPLLHTWSLSIEEQFYLFFPLLLAFLARRGAGLTRVVVLGIAAVSLAIAIVGVEHAPSAAFFLLPSRMWELAIGAMLALDLVPRFRDRRLREWAALSGLLMVVLPCMLYTSKTPFPGLAALVPCVGTAFLLQAGRDGRTAVGELLASPPFVALGLVSYSLYLYHYPILLIARELAGDEQLPPVWTAGAIGLSLLLAILSWKFVERPFRNAHLVSRPTLFASVAAASAFVAIAAIGIVIAAGMPGRLTPGQRVIVAAKDDLDPRFKQCSDAPGVVRAGDPSCVVGVPLSAPSFAIFGDSHASAIAAAIEPLAVREGVAGRLFASGACPPLLGLPMTHLDPATRATCVDRVRREVDIIAADPAITTVFITAYWPAYVRAYGSHASQLIAPALLATVHRLRGKKLVLFYDLPVARIDLPRQLILADRLGRPRPTLDLVGPAGFALVLPELRRQGVRIISLAPPLCPGRRDCPGLIGGHPVLIDTNHLSRTVAQRIVAPYLAAQHLLD